MRILLLIGVAAFLIGGIGCKNKYEKACHNLLDVAAKKEPKEKDKIEKARKLCGDGVKLYLKSLDCVADAGKLADLKTCAKNATEEGMALAKKIEK